MSDTTTTQGGTGQESGTQGGAAGQGQESGQQQVQGTQEGQGQGSNGGQQTQEGQQGGGQGFDVSSIQDPAVRAYVEQQQRQAQEARQEAARYRTERNTLTEREQQRQREAETDQERANREAAERQERLDTLERENRELKVGGAVRAAALGAKAINPDLVQRMLSPQVTLDDKGQPQNVQDLLTSLRQSDPYLFTRVDQGGGEGNGSGEQPTGSMNDRIRSAIQGRRGSGASS